MSKPTDKALAIGGEMSPPWFIFTSYGKGFCVHADTLTQAVADWRRARHKDAGEIVGVIRGADGIERTGRIVQAPC